MKSNEISHLYSILLSHSIGAIATESDARMKVYIVCLHRAFVRISNHPETTNTHTTLTNQDLAISRL